jgi:threonine/homoserine/homoserine lactone efflux protein
VLGALLLLLAVSQWRKRPKAGQDPQLPKWMQAIGKITFPVAFGLGLLLSALNPNLIMAAGSGWRYRGRGPRQLVNSRSDRDLSR